MRRLRSWLLACLFSLGMMGSPAAWAVLCSQVFPQNATASGVVLDLAGLMDGKTYVNFPNSGAHFTSPGTWYYNNGTLGTWDSITVRAGATTWLFFDGDLTLQPQSSINPQSTRLDSGGNPEDLIIIVRGNLTIGTKNDINALIYATGSVSLQPQSSVLGAITAQGTITMGSGASVTYDPYAASTFDLPGLCSDGKVHHYQLSYTSQALTCQPHSITVMACSDADCSSTYAAAASSLAVAPGGSVFSFSGSGSTSIAIRSAQTVNLSVSAADPAPANPLQCRINGGVASSNCSLTFAESGLLVEVPELIAARPDTVRITAVRKSNNSADCVPAFTNVSRQVQLWSTPQSPGSPLVGSPQLRVDGTVISSNVASPSVLTLSFGSTGQSSVPISYDDAGSLVLEASYVGSAATGDPGLTMDGFALFSSRPYGLHISSPADSTCSSASVSGCSMLRMAGDSFPLSIRAVAWQADGEALTEAALRDNPTTPNFMLNGIALNATLVEPSAASGGVAGSFYRHAADGTRQAALTSYDHGQGASTTLQVGQSDVGIYRITATPPAGMYHTMTVSGGTSGLLGRFTPAYLGVTSTASLNPACGAFSYQGQVIPFAGGQPQLAVTGYNRQGEVTRNYDREPFWRLAPPLREAYSLSTAASKPNLAGRLQSLGDAQSLAVVDSGGADGSRAFDWRTEGARQADALLWQLPSPPTSEDLPFTLSAAGEHVALTVPAAGLTDADGICYRGSDGTAASCQDFGHAFGGTEVRVGRLRIDDASGPQDQPLDLPYWLESWQGPEASPVFGPTSGDSCSLGLLGEVQLSGFTGDLQSSHFPTPPGSLEAASGAPLPTGVIRLPAPNHTGSVLASLSGLNGATPVLPWLRFDWNGDGIPEAPTGLATFGVYSGPRALIFRRELYR